ncbi:hypothetical protein GCM10011375_19520 [Hymenobacter qilianensis]|uniref:Uncharacterized protein n=1 Tax=Hymenobacter qilianensis TaxID=1385715 RepID=A0ACB5PRD6_9BACT|nr:hypothetical protein GCM10011375_19520 [Hymenobacter qilianensis]
MPQSYPIAGKRGTGFRWGMGKKKRAKIAPLNRLPLLPSGPGGVQQELVVLTRRCKDRLQIRQMKPIVLIILR